MIKKILIFNKLNKKFIPIYLDGFVKQITKIYREFYKEDFIPSDFDSMVRECFLRKDLDKYYHFNLNHRGIVIIASSGMLLKYSRSTYWAETLFDDAQSAIFFSGYLDFN